MIYITKKISIGEKEVQEVFIHSSGPGGQNVNKVAPAVQLRFNINDSPSLTDDIRERLFGSEPFEKYPDGVPGRP